MRAIRTRLHPHPRHEGEKRRKREIVAEKGTKNDVGTSGGIVRATRKDFIAKREKKEREKERKSNVL